MFRLSRFSFCALALFTLSVASANAVEPIVVDDSQLHARSTTIGGASVLPTTRTIPHWWASLVDPTNGVTYGFNMVGANPNTCAGAACDVTIEVDITPIIVNVGGMTFSGEGVLPATLASPQFATNDYGSTPVATNAALARGAGRRSLARRLRLPAATAGRHDAGAVQPHGL